MKICFIYISPKVSNLKMKGMLINKAILALGNQYMIYQYINALLPMLPAIVYGWQNEIKKE